MSKLYFIYGAMGSAKTAQALIRKFNYEEHGQVVWLLKPEFDNRDGQTIIRSRIGMSSKATVISNTTDIVSDFRNQPVRPNVVIVDEAQFLLSEQVDMLREVVDTFEVSVYCYGLRTDFQTSLFTGSKRLFEICDTIAELKSVCSCGHKAIVNARIGSDGKPVVAGDQLELGGNERYTAMCYSCWVKQLH